MTARPAVVVVGAGPAGLVAAAVLARYELPVLLVERRRGTSNLSRALVISTRAMELLRRLGVEAAVRAGAADVEATACITPSLASPGGTVMPLGYPGREGAAALSPTAPAWAPQDHLEPLLLDLVRASRAVEVRFGVELVDLASTGEPVRAVMRRVDTGQTEIIEAAYLIGADGAHSQVRSLASIEMDGPDDLGEYHRVEFRAPLRDVVASKRHGLYVITDPQVRGVLAPRGVGDRWGLSREHAPDLIRLDGADETALIALIRRASGVPNLPVQIERTNSFRFAAQLARTYRAGRCLLIGDAAHRMTPRGGTGMNTAIQDAFDLAWKLAWVLRGWASHALLDTYESERRPVAAHNVARSSEPGGARRDGIEGLAWDLRGRLAHAWVQPGVSTLDLLDDGLTLLVGPPDTTSRHVTVCVAQAVAGPHAGAVIALPDLSRAPVSGVRPHTPPQTCGGVR